MVSTRNVIIVQRRLTNYRVSFFEVLRGRLLDQGVNLELLIGRPTADEEKKRDGGELGWARHIPTRYAWNGRLCWQSVRSNSGNAELVIVTQENRLIENHLHLLLPRKHLLAFWGHGANLQSDRPNGLKEQFKRWSTRRVDWWFAYTKMSAELVARTGFPENRVTVLNNAIDTASLAKDVESVTLAELSQARQDFGVGGRHVGIFLGSLYPEKRIDFLLDAALLVRQVIPDFELLVVGAGAQADLVRKFSVDRPWVKYVGTASGRQKALLLRLADVMLNPGLVGLGILDSFVGEVPLVTTDCGIHSPEIAYMEQYENGLMTSNSLESFATGVVRVLEDVEFRNNLRVGCRQSSELYTVEQMAERFATGIEHCLSMGRS